MGSKYVKRAPVRRPLRCYLGYGATVVDALGLVLGEVLGEVLGAAVALDLLFALPTSAVIASAL